jgi:hypothetical protein
MRQAKELKEILNSDLNIKKALEQEGKMLKALEAEILAEFDELEKVILMHAKQIEMMKKIRTDAELKAYQSQLVSLTTKITDLRNVFQKIRDAAEKLNRKAISETQYPDRLMVGLMDYIDRITKGIDALLEDMRKNRVSFSGGRKFESTEDIIHSLNLILKEAKAGTNRTIREKYDFVHQEYELLRFKRA